MNKTEHYKSPRLKIKCDLVDCGCKSSTMIWISHSLKVIYFETPKAASSSIKKILNIIPAETGAPKSKFAWGRKNPPENDRFRFEMWCGDEKGVVNSFPNYFKFAIVRNPWDRMLSNWSMFCRTGIPDRERKIEMLFGKKSTEICFDEFIRRSVDIRNHHWQQFVDFLPWDGDTLLIDFIGRMESLEDDWREINRKLGVNVDLLSDNRTTHRHYRDYYDEELRVIVATSHKEDIRVFQYEF